MDEKSAVENLSFGKKQRETAYQDIVNYSEHTTLGGKFSVEDYWTGVKGWNLDSLTEGKRRELSEAFEELVNSGKLIKREDGKYALPDIGSISPEYKDFYEKPPLEPAFTQQPETVSKPVPAPEPVPEVPVTPENPQPPVEIPIAPVETPAPLTADDIINPDHSAEEDMSKVIKEDGTQKQNIEQTEIVPEVTPEIKIEPITEPEITPPDPLLQQEGKSEKTPEWRESDEWKKFEIMRDDLARSDVSFSQSDMSSIGLELKRSEYRNYKEAIAKKIEESFRKSAGENLTPEQEAELKQKIHETVNEELLDKEQDSYRKALRGHRSETLMDKTKEALKSAAESRVAQWYMRQNKWARLGVTTVLFTAGGYALGTAAVGGTLFSAGAYGAGRLGRGAASIFGGGAARGFAEKHWTEDKINEEYKKREEKIKSSDDSLEQKTKDFEDLKKWEEKEKRAIKRNKNLVTIGVGAGAGLLAGLTEGAVSGKGSSDFQEHRVPRGRIEPTAKSGQIPEPQPVKANIPEQVPKPITSPTEKIFDKPEVLVQEAKTGDSVWGMLHKTLDNNEHFKNFGGTGTPREIAEQIEAKQTRALQTFTSEVLKNHDQYGVGPNGEIAVGQKVDFSKLFENNKLFNKAMEDADSLKPRQVSSIIGNNRKIEAWIEANHGKKVNVDEILSAKPKVEAVMEEPVPEPPKLGPMEIETPEVVKSITSELSAIPEAPTEAIGSQPIIAGGAAVAGATMMSVLDREKREQIHKEIAVARERLGVLEGGKTGIAGETLRDGINKIFGKSGVFGFGKVEGVNTKEWKEIEKELRAEDFMKYMEGESERKNLSAKQLKILESPKCQELINALDYLIKKIGKVIRPHEQDKPSDFMLALIEILARKQSQPQQSQLESLQKAA
jgi:hypothetical protein